MTNNNLKIFEHPEFGTIHALQIGGEQWFVGEDITQMLGYNDALDALKNHVDAKDKVSVFPNETEQNQMIIINESGLFSLIYCSKCSNVEKIKSWIQNDVLLVLRKRIDSEKNEDAICPPCPLPLPEGPRPRMKLIGRIRM